MSSQILEKTAHLFSVRPALRYATRFSRYGIGDAVFAGPNPSYGALITYYLKDKPDDKATFKVQIFDRANRLVRELDKPAKEKGLNRVAWDLRYTGAEIRRPPTEEETAFGGGPRGPLVLPGSYIVKLMIGNQVLEQPVDVKLDPTVDVAAADLQAQLDLQMKVRDMQTALNTGLRFIDSIETQLKQTQTTAKSLQKEPDKELTAALEDYLKQVAALQDRLARRTDGLGFGGRSQVSNRLGDIFGSLDTNAAPTPYLRKYFEEVEPDYRARMAELNRFITETVPQWNERLKAWNMPTLATRKAVEF
jgi:hypothetical protein